MEKGANGSALENHDCVLECSSDARCTRLHVTKVTYIVHAYDAQRLLVLHAVYVDSESCKTTDPKSSLIEVKCKPQNDNGLV